MSGEVNEKGADGTDGRIVTHSEVDPEFVYEVSVVDPTGGENKLVIACLMAVSPVGDIKNKTEFWVLKSAWANNRPGERGAKTWTFTPVARADNSDPKLKTYPVFATEAEAISALKKFAGWSAEDVMYKHVVSKVA